jgi:hypothetical protein
MATEKRARTTSITGMRTAATTRIKPHETNVCAGTTQSKGRSTAAEATTEILSTRALKNQATDKAARAGRTAEAAPWNEAKIARPVMPGRLPKTLSTKNPAETTSSTP